MHVRTSFVGTWEVFTAPAVEPGPQREGGFRIR